MTTKADTSVKWFKSTMADAPDLGSSAGSLLSVLDACLIDGFGTRTPDSISVSGGVATVSISAGNPYQQHAVISITGASDTALNAEWRIDTAAASSFTFLCPGVADGTVTGATIKRAAAGWSKPFSASGKAAYQSTNPLSTQLHLRVDDTVNLYALVNVCVGMTGIDAWAEIRPATTATSRWRKSNTTRTGIPWIVVATDSAMFVFLGGLSSTPDALIPYFAGDFPSPTPGDRYNFGVSFTSTASTTTSPEASVSLPNLGTVSSSFAVARLNDQISGADFVTTYTLISGGSPSHTGQKELPPGQKMPVYRGVVIGNPSWVPSGSPRGFIRAFSFPFYAHQASAGDDIVDLGNGPEVRTKWQSGSTVPGAFYSVSLDPALWRI